jgi:hypothetical protein
MSILADDHVVSWGGEERDSQILEMNVSVYSTFTLVIYNQPCNILVLQINS